MFFVFFIKEFLYVCDLEKESYSRNKREQNSVCEITRNKNDSIIFNGIGLFYLCKKDMFMEKRRLSAKLFGAKM
jgi:hypothetical protein